MMSVSPVEPGRCAKPWPVRAVFMLDRYLRNRQGIREYSTHAQCLFRFEEARADQTLSLNDGTCIHRGEPILKLHFWNEHMPVMGRQGASVGWARRASRALQLSLRELARCLDERPEWNCIGAVCGDLRLAAGRENEQLLRIAGRYGFETHPEAGLPRAHALRRIGENILVCMLVLATNPAALRPASLRRESVRIYLSRGLLERRYRTCRTTSL